MPDPKTEPLQPKVPRPEVAPPQAPSVDPTQVPPEVRPLHP
jgi:hypothetical protein